MQAQQRIEMAKVRIKELELLIKYWDAAKAEPNKARLGIVEGTLSNEYEKVAA